MVKEKEVEKDEVKLSPRQAAYAELLALHEKQYPAIHAAAKARGEYDKIPPSFTMKGPGGEKVWTEADE